MTSGLVLSLGAATVWTIVGASPHSVSSLDRRPASWPQAAMISQAQGSRWPERTETEDLGCWTKAPTQPVIVQHKWLRVRGRNCENEPLPQSVVNTTNGFVATVFQLENRKLSTDYVELMDGTNRLEFRHSDASGAIRTTEVSVIFNR